MAPRLFTAALLLVQASTSMALDHKNLDEGRPTRLEDPYPISAGEIAVETGLGLDEKRRGAHRGFFPIQLLYGALPNAHLELSTTLLTESRLAEQATKSGDLRIGALYNLNQETITVPALGLAASAELPTGTDSSKVDGEFKALVSKSVGRLALHLNGGYDLVGRKAAGERRGRYFAAAGTSYSPGAPMHTRTALVLDVFTEQGRLRSERDTWGVEGGVRFQLTQWTVLDAGASTEFAGPGDRSDLRLVVGLSVGY